MRTVSCEECGKHYDFDLDDFCPRCGAFNYPGAAADGMVVRVDGINESNHEGSFLHEELHRENRQRFTKGFRKSAAASAQSRKTAGGRSSAEAESEKKQGDRMIAKATAVSWGAVIAIIVALMFFNIVSRFVFFF